MRRRSPGDVIAIQEEWRGRLWAARPATVVRDEDELLVLWCPAGTRWKLADTPAGRPRRSSRTAWYLDLLTRGDWILADAVWRTPTLWLVQESESFAVWVTPPGGAETWQWYVNFEEPFVRTSSGIRATDLILDIVVAADRTWRWKDESDFEALVAHGIVDAELARRVRRDAAGVIDRIERGSWPFDGSWLDWLPRDRSRIPELPAGWDVVSDPRRPSAPNERGTGRRRRLR